LTDSEKSWIDRNPTILPHEDGKMRNPDKDQRFSIKYTDGKREYQCDNKPCDLNDFVGATSGKENIPSSVGVFGGYGDGLMKKAYESDADFRKRINK